MRTYKDRLFTDETWAESRDGFWMVHRDNHWWLICVRSGRRRSDDWVVRKARPYQPGTRAADFLPGDPIA